MPTKSKDKKLDFFYSRVRNKQQSQEWKRLKITERFGSKKHIPTSKCHKLALSHLNPNVTLSNYHKMVKFDDKYSNFDVTKVLFQNKPKNDLIKLAKQFGKKKEELRFCIKKFEFLQNIL